MKSLLRFAAAAAVAVALAAGISFALAHRPAPHRPTGPAAALRQHQRQRRQAGAAEGLREFNPDHARADHTTYTRLRYAASGGNRHVRSGDLAVAGKRVGTALLLLLISFVLGEVVLRLVDRIHPSFDS